MTLYTDNVRGVLTTPKELFLKEKHAPEVKLFALPKLLQKVCDVEQTTQNLGQTTRTRERKAPHFGVSEESGLKRPLSTAKH